MGDGTDPPTVEENGPVLFFEDDVVVDEDDKLGPLVSEDEVEFVCIFVVFGRDPSKLSKLSGGLLGLRPT